MKDINILKNVIVDVDNTIKEYKNEDIIYHEGDLLTSIGIVLDGCVIVKTSTLDGFQFEVNKILKGDIFGSALAFKDNPILPGNITSYKSSKIMFITIKNFKLLLVNNKQFLLNYLEYEANRNIYLQYKVKLLGQPSIREKILFYLKEEIKKTSSNIVYLNMSKEKLSELLSVNRPSLSRELIRMKEDNLIDYDRYKIKCLFIK